MDSVLQQHTRILSAYRTPLPKDCAITPLDREFRETLTEWAESEPLQCSQDHAGNIYITHAGQDPDLAPIAISFPIDGANSSNNISSALNVFSQLCNKACACSVTLLGWTSVSGNLLGRDLWAQPTQIEQHRPSNPWLEDFSECRRASEFPLSAIFEIAEDSQGPLKLVGSHILIQRARENPASNARVEYSISKASSTRAPEIMVKGNDAEKMAQRLIQDYSEYVAAIFDTF
ncbi:hypothetical protein NA57DRAFT_69844 [Rhizodiscina lignyota]|uniref:Uncharacterized protein n=1 Tax=Rhizodiscina lignyota TaxID=1504668 RepID=A0A9P4MAU5_9PEZI|nr:hypothetical protein NA57DRAFT_69844 [Rhizodiscina lignyota]